MRNIGLMALLIGCREADKLVISDEATELTDSGFVPVQDADGDGYFSDEECDDNNPDIYPNAVELCDGIDNNCNGEIDEGVIQRYYADVDEDGFGDPETEIESCDQLVGYVSNGVDCNDTDDAIYPGSPEVCNDIDDNCDGNIDEDLFVDLFFDADGDGHGDPNQQIDDCHGGEGYVLFGDDCDDTNPDIHPIRPELCDGIDNNCDGQIDEGAIETYYADTDEDGFGDPDTTLEACGLGEGWVYDNTDCDDADSEQYPGADEVCNNEDDDCDGVSDEEPVDGTTWYYDIDGDGYGSAFITVSECVMPAGYTAQPDDCDDTRDTTFPGAQEYCNNRDNDCNGTIDDNALDATLWYADTDFDGFGDPNDSQLSCEQPFDYIADNTDCDDTNEDVHPEGIEVCNELDDDCSGVVDDQAIDAITFYLDDDVDGFGDPDISVDACAAPQGYILDGTDCDDADLDIFPGAQEYCDGIDQNCNGNNFYELDLDSNGKLACEESVWMRNSSSNSTSPYGASSQSASYLLNQGVTVWDVYHGNQPVTSAYLENFGLYVHHGNNMNGSLGAYTNSEATAIADWVYEGGRMLFIGFHSTEDACEASNSIPYQFGVSCDTVFHSWSGTTSSFVSHPITDGLGTVGGLGGENWVVTAPAQVLASVNGYEFLVVVEYGAGKVVLVADEWPYYNPRGWYSINYGSNRQMVHNIWDWLLE